MRNWRTVAIRKINLKLHNLTNFLTHSTHSICGCQRLATFALLAPPAGNNYNVLNGPNISEQNDILVGIMAAIILILAIVVVAILSCYCRKRKVSNQWQSVKTICFFRCTTAQNTFWNFEVSEDIMTKFKSEAPHIIRIKY